MREVALAQLWLVDALDNYTQYWDDVSGEPLDTEGVQQARKEELVHVHKHEVYRKVPISQCIERTGKLPIGTRWVDINKGDSVHPEFRSRVVGQEIKSRQA